VEAVGNPLADGLAASLAEADGSSLASADADALAATLAGALEVAAGALAAADDGVVDAGAGPHAAARIPRRMAVRALVRGERRCIGLQRCCGDFVPQRSLRRPSRV
jgi:hypothetical protein